MFERFTDHARRVVVLALEEARLLNHNYLGTQHLLLGLLHQEESVACGVLGQFGVTLELARTEVERIVGRGKREPSGYIPFTQHAKKVLELSLHESMQLRTNYIGTEHILLALVRDDEDIADQVLERLGVDVNELRQAVLAAMPDPVEIVPVRWRMLHRVSMVSPTNFRCGACDDEITLVGMPGEVQIRIERNEVDLRLRIYVTAGDAPEYLAPRMPRRDEPAMTARTEPGSSSWRRDPPFTSLTVAV